MDLEAQTGASKEGNCTMCPRCLTVNVNAADHKLLKVTLLSCGVCNLKDNGIKVKK